MIPGRWREVWKTPVDRPQVGDWVAGTPSAELGALLDRTALRAPRLPGRQAAAERPELQAIAANVDIVGVVSALGDGADAKQERWLIDPKRIGRYLEAVEQSGARPLPILNKSDLHHDSCCGRRATGRGILGVPVVPLSGGEGTELESLDPWLRPGQTLVLVGLAITTLSNYVRPNGPSAGAASGQQFVEQIDKRQQSEDGNYHQRIRPKPALARFSPKIPVACSTGFTSPNFQRLRYRSPSRHISGRLELHVHLSAPRLPLYLVVPRRFTSELVPDRARGARE